MRTEVIRYFPFSEGLPYHLKNGKYIIPKMDLDNWYKAFEKKIAVLCLGGGFIENLFALSFFEVINYYFPGKKMEWCGNLLYKDLNKFQGLAKESTRINSDDLIHYPVPLFYNKSKTAVFMNCLNNYRNISTYAGEFSFRDHCSLFKQIFRNLMIDWNVDYFPRLRRLEANAELMKLAKISKFDLVSKYVLLIPDITGWSDYDELCLHWELGETRSFAAMLYGTGYNLVILTPHPQRYYGIKAFIPPLSVENLIYLMKNSRAVLAKEIDFILAALFIGNNFAFSVKTFDEFRVEKNAKYLGISKKFYIDDKLTPMKVYEELYGKSFFNDGHI